jgi:hypothetical protein
MSILTALPSIDAASTLRDRRFSSAIAFAFETCRSRVSARIVSKAS